MPTKASFQSALPWVLSLFVAFVFIQSLFFKFTGSPETVYIFETKLDAWAASLGYAGIFAPGGIFSAKVIGSLELLASAMLLLGLFIPRFLLLNGLGALLGLGVITGAIGFHLFTPLGIAVHNADGSSDGGALFAMACGVWLSCAGLVYLRRHVLLTALDKRRHMATA